MATGLESAVFDILTADPVSPEEGQLWYRSDLDGFFYYDGAGVRSFVDAPVRPYDRGALMVVRDGQFLILVDPEISGADSISIEGNGQLVVF